MFGAHSTSLRRFRVPCTLLLAGLLSSTSSGAVDAQVIGPDTVFYREVNSVLMTRHLPTGPNRLQLKQDHLIGVRATRPGMAQAWFEELALTIETSEGAVRLPTDPVLRQLYVLSFDSAGHATPLRTPVAPEWIVGIVDPSKQFVDFFMPIPRKPLSLGLVWVDTLPIEGNIGINRTVRGQRVGQFDVVGDSAIRGIPVFIVRATIKQQMTTAGPDASGINTVSEQDGTENSRFYIAKSNMRMMARRSTGSFRGALVYDGLLRIPTTMTYTGRIDVDPRERRHLTAR